MYLLRIPFPTVAAAIMATGFAGIAAAQETKAMDTVVVTASGYEQLIKEAPASISVVTREELEKKAYTNLHDALRDVPGVILTPSDNNSNDIALRGMGANYTLILVDGKRTNSRETQTNGSTGTDQSWIPPLEAIERIEVVRGPMSSLYGSDAMGGVINVITRKVAKEWHGSLRADATLQERSTSGNAYQSNFYLSGPIKEDLLGLSIYGNYTQREEDRIYQGYNDYDNRAINVKLALTPNKDHDVILELGTAKQHFTSTPGMTLLDSEALSDRRFERESYSLQHKGRWGWATSDTYVQQEETRNIARDMTIKNTVFNSSWTLPLGQRNLLTTGVYYSEQDLKDTTTNTLPGSSRSTADRSQYAVFAENEWRLRDDFALTGGLRYDHDSQAGGHVSPRLYGVWTVDPRWTVKGGVSSGFRAPSLRQTLGDWGQSSRGGNIYGNPDLKPETSLTKEIGLLFDAGNGTTAGLTLFDNDFKDKITRIACPTCGPLNSSGRVPTTNVNVDKAITRGIEATLGTQLTQNLGLTSSYTFTTSEQKSGEFAGKPLNQLPRHLLNVSLDWNPTGQINGWTKVSYRGKESDSSGAASSGTFNQKSYAMLDLGGSYKYSKTVTLYAGIYNLLDKEVLYDGVNYDSVLDGRRYWLGMNVKF
ncbi:ligand-gated channel protein [Comamonas sp.]|uniref:ligand-gated channel protein n=1 Tax=Comamonas sp. TaxID=34028 RepID=UPI003FA5D848